MTEDSYDAMVGFSVLLLLMFFVGYFVWNVSGRKDSVKNAFLGSGGIIVWIVAIGLIAEAVGNDYFYLLILLSPAAVIGTIKLFGGKKDNRSVEIASADDLSAKLEKLFALKEKGILSQQEFDERKTALLNKGK